jgi:hypothetical protein
VLKQKAIKVTKHKTNTISTPWIFSGRVAATEKFVAAAVAAKKEYAKIAVANKTTFNTKAKAVWNILVKKKRFVYAF